MGDFEILAKGTRPLSQSGETAVKGVIWKLQILLLARIGPFLLVEVNFHPFPRRRVRWTIATWQKSTGCFIIWMGWTRRSSL